MFSVFADPLGEFPDRGADHLTLRLSQPRGSPLELPHGDLVEGERHFLPYSSNTTIAQYGRRP